MKLVHAKWPLTCLAGILMIIINNILIMISWIFFPGAFSIFESTISTLGNSNRNPIGAIFLRLSNILTGILFFAFYFGLFIWDKNDLSNRQRIYLRISILLGFLTGFASIMVGIYSQEYRPYHLIWAGIFFFLNCFALVMMGMFLHEHPLGIRSIVIINFIIALFHFTLILVLTIDAIIFEWLILFIVSFDYLLLVYNFKVMHDTELNA